MTQPIHIFGPGRHTATSGATRDFSEADLQAAAAAYDPAVHEAPIVVGHPTENGPAYGWVERLSYGSGALEAHPRQVDPAFAELVKTGRFKKVSASFYLSDSPANPKPGALYLRHVGFLGAQPPAVKGLRPVQFAEGEDGVVEFAASAEDTERGLGRALLDFFRRAGAAAGATASFTEASPPSAAAAPTSTPEEETMSDTVDLAERTKQLDEREASFAERERKLKEREARLARQEIGDFAEAQVAAGRVLPREKDGLVEFMAQLGAKELSFGEGDEATRTTPRAWFEGFVSELPKRVDFREVSKPDGAPTGAADLPVPAGYTVDQDRLEVHRRAVAYAEKHDTDYLTAVRAVSAGS